MKSGTTPVDSTAADHGAAADPSDARPERKRKRPPKTASEKHFSRDVARSSSRRGKAMTGEFLLFYGAGAGYAVVSEIYSGIPNWVDVAVPLLAVFGYGLYGYAVGRARSPTTQEFADNCYFLGFLFTLTYLFAAFAGLTFDAEAELSSRDIVSKFSVALGSTIAGLLIRTAIVNSADDLGQQVGLVEEQLLKYADQVRLSAGKVVDTIDSLGDHVTQLGERVDGFVDTASNTGKSVEDHFRKLVEINDRVAGAFDGARTRFETAVEGAARETGLSESAVARAVEQFNAELEGLRKQIRDNTGMAIEQMGTHAELIRTATGAIEMAPEAVDSLNAAKRVQHEQARNLSAAMDEMTKALNRFNSYIEEMNRQTETRL